MWGTCHHLVMVMMMVICHNLMIVMKRCLAMLYVVVKIMVCHHQIIVMTMKCPQKNSADVEKEPRGSQPSVEFGGYVTIWWRCSGLLYNVASFAGRCVTISSHVTTPFSAKCWLRRSYSIKFLENSCSAKDRKEDWILSRNIMPKKNTLVPPPGDSTLNGALMRGRGLVHRKLLLQV